MKVFVGGACDRDNIFTLMDQTAFSESEFESHVVAALNCVYKDYLCIPFRGAFRFEGETHIADLALIHRNLAHWFVIEVELISHSLHGHVVPQVRSFKYGVPQNSCIDSLCKYVPNLSREQAQSFLEFVPRTVAVVANRPDRTWSEVLRAIDSQFIAVSVFERYDGFNAFETEGSLYAPSVSLGFFTYSASTRSFRMDRSCGLSEGVVQIQDPSGNVGLWTVRSSQDALWLTKNVGDPGLEDRGMFQMLKSDIGAITLRSPSRLL